MKVAKCSECGHCLTPWEGYILLNFRQLICPDCKTVLVPDWRDCTRPKWQQFLYALAWSFPAIVAMVAVWFMPTLWFYLMLGLIVFHLLALGVICIGGFYQIKKSDK